jgi:hypothetical protein
MRVSCGRESEVAFPRPDCNLASQLGDPAARDHRVDGLWYADVVTDPASILSIGDQPPRQTPARGFRIHWYNWILFGAVCLSFCICVLAATPPVTPGASDAYRSGFVAGTFLGAILIPALISLVPTMIAYFVSRRSTRAVNITLLATLVFLLALGCLAALGNMIGGRIATKRAQHDAAMRQMDELRDSLRAKAQKKIDNQGFSTASPEEAAEMASKMDAIASKLTGEEAVIVKAESAASKSIVNAGVPMGQALAAFMQAGAVRPPTLKSRADIEKRLKLLDEVVKTNGAMRLALQTAPEECRQALIAGGIKAARADTYVQAFEQGGKIATLTRMCDARDDFGKAAHEYLSILHEQWGKWTVEDDEVLFSDDSAVDDFNAAIEDLRKAEAAQVQLTEEMGFKAKGQAPAGTDK